MEQNDSDDKTRIVTPARSMLHQLWEMLCDARRLIADLEAENKKLRELLDKREF